jgi:murein tripeptide amidase MpaA
MQKIGETKPAENAINEVVMKKKRQRLPMVLIVSGLLANDWGSVLTSIAIMNKFFSDVEKTDRLLTDFSFHFLPLLNPDGYNYSMALVLHKSNYLACNYSTNSSQSTRTG